jgi:ATP-dependent helicase HrpB
MLLRAGAMGATSLACDLAAMLGERDLLRGTQALDDADLELRLTLLRGETRGPTNPALDRGALQRIRRQSAGLRRRLREMPDREPPDGLAGVLLALAYPDRIGQRRADGRFLLSGGRGAVFRRPQRLSNSEFVVAAELDSGEREAQIFLAASISREQLEAHFSNLIESAEDITWDDQAGAVVATRQTRLGALRLAESRIGSPDPAAIQRALLEGIRKRGPTALPFSAASRSLRERVAFLRQLAEGPAQDWPALDDARLMDELEQWLGPWLEGVGRLTHLERIDLHAALMARLGHPAVGQLESLAPTHFEVPSGSRLPIDYADPAAPALAVRLQEVFGMLETPRLAGGRVPLTLKLLSPAQRPVQVTRDLAGFWARGYAEVRKELKGRYPKHFWPDDPASAPATRRIRPRQPP